MVPNPPSFTVPTMSNAVKRACDACHRRKVKCDGINPCRNCSSAQLTCTYNAIPQKKGPKGSRAKVISELRETQRRTDITTKPNGRLGEMHPGQMPNPHGITPGLLTPAIVKETIDFYFTHLYSIMPILHRGKLEQQVNFMENPDNYCLIASLAAFVMLQPGFNMPPIPGMPPQDFYDIGQNNLVTASLVMDEAVRVRRSYDHTASRDHNSMCTSYLLFAWHYTLDMPDKAWIFLRDATTMAHLASLHKEDTYLQYDNIEASRRRRLYWQLFVAERAYALKYQRPVTLAASISPPSITDDPTDPLAHELNVFISKVNVYRPFDDTFLPTWNRLQSSCSALAAGMDVTKLGNHAGGFISSPDSQLAEKHTNQQWLKNLNWQLNLHNTQNAGDESSPGSFQMPRELISMGSNLPPQGMDIFRLGHVSQLCSPPWDVFVTLNAVNADWLFQMDKLFDVTCGLADVLAALPARRDPYSFGSKQQLQQLLDIITVLRGGDYSYMPLLVSKVHEFLPELANPNLQNAPENSNLGGLDIFDALVGGSTMQQPTQQMTPIDSKYQVPVVDPSGSPNPPSAATDLSPAFSPGLISPGFDFSQPPLAAHHHASMEHFVALNGMGNMGAMSEMMVNSIASAPTQSLPSQGNLGQATQTTQQHMQLGGLQTAGVHVPLQSNSLNHPSNNHPPDASTSMGPRGMMGANQPMGGANGAMLARQPPHRANSYAVPPPIPRTIADFHALQRSTSENVATMGTLGAGSLTAANMGDFKIDFANMRS